MGVGVALERYQHDACSGRVADADDVVSGDQPGLEEDLDASRPLQASCIYDDVRRNIRLWGETLTGPLGVCFQEFLV